jgi:tetratricopeptide (TPR) repeat protein
LNGVKIMDKNQLGIQYMQEGKWEEAAKTFNEAIEETPKDPIAYINFGNLLAVLNETEKAHQFYKKAIDLDENAGAAYYSAGNLFFEESNFHKAKDMFELALKKGLQTADNYFMLGLSLVNLDQPRLALPYLQRSVELQDNDAEARFQYGLCLAQESFIDESIEQFEACILLDSTHADAYYNLGVAFGFREDAKKALLYFNKALEAQPDHVLAGYGKKLIQQN